MTAYRAFTNGSWWNTAMPSNAPIDASSNAWRTLLINGYDAWIKLTIDNANAQAIYYPTGSDPLYTVNPSGGGPTVTVRIPTGAQPGSQNFSAKLLLIDQTTNQGVQLFGANFVGGNWTATGTDRYYLDSNGLDESQGGATGNSGHRGATSTTRSPRLEEVRTDALIRHRIHMFMPPTLTGPDPVFPMTGSDGSNNNGIPEGTVLRVKQSVNLAARGLTGGALVVAQCLQDYGAMVADGGAATAATIRMERGDWTGSIATKDAMSALGWNDYEFIQGGYDPTVGGGSTTISVSTKGTITYQGSAVAVSVPPSPVAVSPAGITYAGKDVSVLTPFLISPVPGAITYVGKDVGVVAPRYVPVVPAALTYVGLDVELGSLASVSSVVPVQPGGRALVGSAVFVRGPRPFSRKRHLRQRQSMN